MSDNKIVISNNRKIEDTATELTIEFMKCNCLSKEEVAEVYKLFHKTATEAWNGKY